MDFGRVLNVAQKNEKSTKKPEVRYYSTKFEPPKKEQRNKQQLSENIKRFLAKKEVEEKKQQLAVLRKKEELLALRAKDKKATRRVNVMLKRTKSANQSVMDDAGGEIATESSQPDEDDYGYVSQEASAFYNKMMEKYSKIPDDPKFGSSGKKRVSGNLASTKDRVKAALEREREEANMPHRRKRKHEDHQQDEKDAYVEEKPEKSMSKPKAKPAPPPLNFNDLLKLAEKKQFEPIIIEKKPQEKEKPLTKKQKLELEKQREWRERKEGKLPPLEPKTVPKVAAKLEKTPAKVTTSKEVPVKKPPLPTNTVDRKIPKVNGINSSISKSPADSSRKTLPQKQQLPNKSREYIPTKQSAPVPSRNVQADISKKQQERIKQLEMELEKARKAAVQEKYVPEVKSKPIPPSQKSVKNETAKPRYLPPMKKPKLQVNKGRLLDEDDEEYDSEMDDFIDDGPEESEDYSKYISEIFGYDKSKYRNLDDDVDNMESTFAQQMREEVISTKIGIMEDLEDMRMEEEEKRRKAVKKKQMRS